MIESLHDLCSLTMCWATGGDWAATGSQKFEVEILHVTISSEQTWNQGLYMDQQYGQSVYSELANKPFVASESGFSAAIYTAVSFVCDTPLFSVQGRLSTEEICRK